MRSKWNLLFGLLIILVGIFFLLNGIFGWRYDFGDFLGFLWPIALIVLGIYLLRRQTGGRDLPEGAQFCTRVFGDLKLDGSDLSPEGLATEMGIGDIQLDLAASSLAEKEHRIQIRVGIGDINIIIPQGIPVKAHSSAGIGSVNLLGKKGGWMGSNVHFESEQYRSSRRRLFIETKSGIGDIVLTRSET
ncbi:MAG: cell wall-active antibiotics response protein [Planctomycetes bacterium]|nr:cell wall-active antibiotics response protein [Planctomycetota bacterium]